MYLIHTISSNGTSQLSLINISSNNQAPIPIPLHQNQHISFININSANTNNYNIGNQHHIQHRIQQDQSAQSQNLHQKLYMIRIHKTT